MKKRNLFCLFTIALLVISCSKEGLENEEANLNLNVSSENVIYNQLPNAKFDQSPKGLYHGIIASGTNQSRGKIWINLGNNGEYNALVKMVGGQTYSYTLNKKESNTKIDQYVFKSNESSFTVDVSDFNNPEFKNVYINSEPYFAQVLKGTNNRMPFSFTGVFEDIVPGSAFAGTWNVISTGVPAPEGFGYETIGQAVVTFNGDMYVDATFELFNYPCVGNPSFTPQMGDTSGNPNTILAHAQTSNFDGPTSWDLATAAATYFDNTCSIISSGTFTWTNLAGTITKDGLIFID